MDDSYDEYYDEINEYDSDRSYDDSNESYDSNDPYDGREESDNEYVNARHGLSKQDYERTGSKSGGELKDDPREMFLFNVSNILKNNEFKKITDANKELALDFLRNKIPEKELLLMNKNLVASPSLFYVMYNDINTNNIQSYLGKLKYRQSNDVDFLRYVRMLFYRYKKQ